MNRRFTERDLIRWVVVAFVLFVYVVIFLKVLIME